MHVCRICSKLLISFAALLSPVQPLQGTPVLCQLVGCYQGELTSTRDLQLGEGLCCKCGQTSPQANGIPQQRRCGASLARIEQTNQQHNCPADCWCRRPAQPQSQTTSREQLKVSDSASEPVDGQHHGGCSVSPYRRTTPQPTTFATISAQQVCASLCRFTT
jgi:hypothetical protein